VAGVFVALLGHICWAALSHIEWRSGPPTGMMGMIDTYPSFPLARKLNKTNAVMASKRSYIKKRRKNNGLRIKVRHVLGDVGWMAGGVTFCVFICHAS